MRQFRLLTQPVRQLFKRLVDYVHHVEDTVVPERFRRVYRFFLSGIPSQALYYLFYISLTYLGLYYLISAAVGFAFYLALNFVLMRRWVFGSEGHPLKERVGHLVLHISNQGISMVGLYVLVTIWGKNFILAQLAVSILYFFSNLLLSRYIFDPKDSE